MYGWRARIGLITPMGDNIEHAFHKYAPEGVSFASTKIPLPDPTFEQCRDAYLDTLEQVSCLYKETDIDLLLLGCTFGSHNRDIEWEQTCADRMEKASNIPSTTSNLTVLEAFNTLNVHKCAILTPYLDSENEKERKYWESNGISVTSISGMNVDAITRKGKTIYSDADEYFIYQKKKKVHLDDADAVYLDCIQLTTLEIIDGLEGFYQLPVITSQQAALWGAVRRCRVGAKLPQLGKLFTM